MLNNEEPINLMFRTSLQLLTMSSYDSICRQNYGGGIIFRVHLIFAHLVFKHPTPNIICVIASKTCMLRMKMFTVGCSITSLFLLLTFEI